MKICIFSDIHGNGPAFRVAYPVILNEKADINIFLGDLYGYYFDQNSIFNMLQDIPNLVAILGNHDSYFLRVVHGERGLKRTYRKKYGTSIDRLLDSSPSELIKWLADLPQSYTFHEVGVSLYHGSPWDALEGYVYPDSLLERFLDYDASVFFLGHTHYPMDRTINNIRVINPGSCGQPRDYNQPSYAIYDPRSGDVRFKRVRYNIDLLIEDVLEHSEKNEYLIDILKREKQK